MKPSLLLLLLVQLLLLARLESQVFAIDTLQYGGDADRYINLVILGDGYTAAEQNEFSADAGALTAHLFAQTPWQEYAAYFNVFAIRVISAESGVIHPRTETDCAMEAPDMPVTNPDTYFGCSFDSYGLHRLVVPTKPGNVVDVLAANFPAYDQVLILANSGYYGGSGGNFATSTVNSSCRLPPAGTPVVG